MESGNKSHGWVLNSLSPHPIQGAGDDWWECFPVRLWDWRVAGTGLFKGWDMSVNIIFSDTPFPSLVIIVVIHIWRKLINPNYYLSVSNVLRNIFFSKECGSYVRQLNGLQAHQTSAKTLQQCNPTLNNRHDFTEKQILSLTAQDKTVAKLINTPIQQTWWLLWSIIYICGLQNVW